MKFDNFNSLRAIHPATYRGGGILALRLLKKGYEIIEENDELFLDEE